jgi:hypothetical protein
MTAAKGLSTEEAIKAYKLVLARIIDKRPSGTRQRLADVLGKHRSFVTQMTGAAYPTPVPERHVPALFSVCHFSADERAEFLAAYQIAHPDRAVRIGADQRMRHVTLMLPDMGDDERNRRFDEALGEFVQRLGSIINGGEA